MYQVFKHSKWFKGNLHTHTTLSDGCLSPEDCIELYRKQGYDFLAITDHRKYHGSSNMGGFLILPGTELHINDFDTKRAYHIVGLGIKANVPSDDNNTPQQLIDGINRQGGLAVVAHPAWSLLTHQDIMELTGYHGIEIWNSVSETDSGRGDSTSYIDVLASKGCYTNISAVDDTHFYKKELFGGYIMVNAPALEEDSILEAVRSGDFYCSQGPEIKQIYTGGGRIAVETSPVETILFMSDTFFTRDRVHSSPDGLITSAGYELKPTDRFVRIECRDESGRKAWSQIIQV